MYIIYIYIYIFIYIFIYKYIYIYIYIYLYIYPFTRDYLLYIYTPIPLSLIQAFLINVYLKNKNNFQNDYLNLSR